MSKVLKYINEKPEEFAERLLDDDLRDVIKELSEKYYNKGISGVCDNSFDALVYYYKKRMKKKNVTNISSDIGAIPEKKYRKPLPFHTPSLNKIKVGFELTNILEFNSVNETHDSEIVWSVKLDGVSGIIEYENRRPKNVFLRGNGKIGSDISHVIDHIDFPVLDENCPYPNMVVRGEFVLDKDTWESKYCSDHSDQNGKNQSFTTSRNFVCGKLNSHTVTSALEDIFFIAFDIMYLNSEKGKSLPCMSETFDILIENDFEVPDYGVVNQSDSEKKLYTSDIVQLYSKNREDCPYPIDGIVLAKNVKRFIAEKLENPSHTIAFKMQLEEQIKETEVTGIEWNISRYGILVPVVCFKPVYIEGRKVQKAHGHNARRVINTWMITKGMKINVTLSGCIIPKIVKVFHKSETLTTSDDVNRDDIIKPPKIPNWKWVGCDIILCDVENNETVKLKRIEHFFESINIPSIRMGTIKHMKTAGLNSISSIVNADKKALMKVYRVGDKTADKFLKSFKEKLPYTKLYRMLYASNCFARGTGKTLMRTVVLNFPSFLTDSDRILKANLMSLSGIGPKKSQNFIDGLTKFKAFMKNFPDIMKNNEHIHLEKNKKIDGKEFVFTTVSDDDLEDYILDNGGRLGKIVTKKTRIVVTGNPLDFTQKTRDAIELGIKVVTISEFYSLFKS
tara:strand:+ start:658 stop:2688 length:2031 start_codon:yes stop_codon:yes gene_type:complete